jgi:hypothetical protein
MRESIDRSHMRGVAIQLDGAEIEFAGEPEILRARILEEHLPPAKQGGMAAAARSRARRISAGSLRSLPRRVKGLAKG